VEIDGKAKPIFKDPKTGGHKKSAKGLLAVVKDKGGKLTLKNDCTPEEELGGELKVMFENGVQFNKTTLGEIRGRLE
jgi:nicotinamide phosphoribosyltransferase